MRYRSIFVVDTTKGRKYHIRLFGFIALSDVEFGFVDYRSNSAYIACNVLRAVCEQLLHCWFIISYLQNTHIGSHWLFRRGKKFTNGIDTIH